MNPDQIIEALRREPDFDCPCTCGDPHDYQQLCPFCDATAENREERIAAADLLGFWQDKMSESFSALVAVRNQLAAAKSSLAADGKWTNAAGYTTDAALWIERSLNTAHEAVTKELGEI